MRSKDRLPASYSRALPSMVPCPSKRRTPVFLFKEVSIPSERPNARISRGRFPLGYQKKRIGTERGRTARDSDPSKMCFARIATYASSCLDRSRGFHPLSLSLSLSIGSISSSGRGGFEHSTDPPRTMTHSDIVDAVSGIPCALRNEKGHDPRRMAIEGEVGWEPVEISLLSVSPVCLCCLSCVCCVCSLLSLCCLFL